MGAILALNEAIQNPSLVTALILINPPVVTSHEDLKADIEKNSSRVMVAMTFNKFWGKLVCRMHEFLPTMGYPFIRLLEPELPPEVAMAATKHTYESFSGSLEHVLQSQKFFELLSQTNQIPTLIISSKEDAYAKQTELDQLKQMKNIKVRVLQGNHNFILKSPGEALSDIREFLRDFDLKTK